MAIPVWPESDDIRGEGFRWCLLGSGAGSSFMLALSALVAIVLLISGMIWFRRRERSFVDSLGSGSV
jgi:ABC-type polysaccharide/polyol phosphate export permease